ncbi:MAG: sigma-70 family RNA polymerase sigma factor [Pirellulaceae bacterium]|nr:sigma-70 family RNA polymerase sigma factor [Pirellulaceae bacterium]
MDNQLLQRPAERELLQRAKTGDFTAFQELVAQLQPRVYGLAFRILQQVQDAEDTVQQTFLSLIEHIGEFREESSIATWVLKIASNHALKILRKKRGLQVTSMHAVDPDDRYDSVPHPEFISPWSKTPEEIAEQSEVHDELERALSQLNEKYRSVFVLRDVEGLSVKETAEALELTESTVKVRLLRARLALREQLTRKFGDPQRVMIPDHNHG